MKKLFAVGLIMTGLLVGCSDEQTVQEIQPDVEHRFNGVNGDINIITDSKTGCKYIYVDSGSGTSHAIALSPLYIDSRNVDCSK